MLYILTRIYCDIKTLYLCLLYYVYYVLQIIYFMIYL